MKRDDQMVLAAAAITAGLIPRRSRLAAGVAGAIVLSRAHGAARDRQLERAYRDFEGYVEEVIARHRGGLVDRVDDLEDLAALQHRHFHSSPIDPEHGPLERLRARRANREEAA